MRFCAIGHGALPGRSEVGRLAVAGEEVMSHTEACKRPLPCSAVGYIALALTTSIAILE